MGQRVPAAGHGGLSLGRYDPAAFARGGDAGLVVPGGWRGLAAHDLGRPGVSLRDASRLGSRLEAAGGGAPRSALDLAGLSSAPRILPALGAGLALESIADGQRGRRAPLLGGPSAGATGAPSGAALGGHLGSRPSRLAGRAGPGELVAPAGRSGRSGGAAPAGSSPAVTRRGPTAPQHRGPTRPARSGSFAGADPITGAVGLGPELGGLGRGRQARGAGGARWQTAAQQQLDGAEPVFGYAADGLGATSRPAPLLSRADVTGSRSGAGWGELPAMRRAGGDGASLVSFRPQGAGRGDHGALRSLFAGAGVDPGAGGRAAFGGAPVGTLVGRAPAGQRSSALRGPGVGLGGRQQIGQTGFAAQELAQGRSPRTGPAPERGEAPAPTLLGRGSSGAALGGFGGSRGFELDAASGLGLPPSLLGSAGGRSQARLGMTPGPRLRDREAALPAALRPAHARGPSTELPAQAPRIVEAPAASGPAPAAPARRPAPTARAAGQPSAYGGSRAPTLVGRPTRSTPSEAFVTSAPEMETTSLVSGPAGGGVLRKESVADVDASGDAGRTHVSRAPDVEASSVAAPPADLSLLVNQIYAQIKRELTIEKERKG